MRSQVAFCAAALAAVIGSGAASRAGATTIFNDNFDEELIPAGSTWIMNDNSFTNFNVVGGGTVDLLTAGNPFGLTGSGTNSSGNFVDLDGSTDHGGFLQTKQAFSFNAGDTVTLSVDVGGNERSGTDGLFAGFQFAGAPAITNLTASGLGNFTMANDQILGTAQLASTAPFQTYSISFTAISAGSINALVGTDSADNVGPLLDHVILSDLSTAVPEPAAWAFLITGFGAIGALMRRDRRRAATA